MPRTSWPTGHARFRRSATSSATSPPAPSTTTSSGRSQSEFERRSRPPARSGCFRSPIAAHRLRVGRCGLPACVGGAQPGCDASRAGRRLLAMARSRAAAVRRERARVPAARPLLPERPFRRARPPAGPGAPRRPRARAGVPDGSPPGERRPASRSVTRHRHMAAARMAGVRHGLRNIPTQTTKWPDPPAFSMQSAPSTTCCARVWPGSRRLSEASRSRAPRPCRRRCGGMRWSRCCGRRWWEGTTRPSSTSRI